jgi:hypothetical protein
MAAPALTALATTIHAAASQQRSPMCVCAGGNEYYQAVTFSNTKQPVTAVSIDGQALTYVSNR